MLRSFRRLLLMLFVFALSLTGVPGQTQKKTPNSGDSDKKISTPASKNLAAQPNEQTSKPPATDLTKEPTLYVVGYAHLDTQWRWEFPQTISEYLLKTMRVNFDYIDKYPHYVFNWTGANRYRLMKEYFPSDYLKMKGYIDAGSWYPAGSSMEEGDVNAPNAEAIIREILYGNTYFRREFGRAPNICSLIVLDFPRPCHRFLRTLA